MGLLIFLSRIDRDRSEGERVRLCALEAAGFDEGGHLDARGELFD